MFYKPRFCCNCGEKIEREEWRPWTSRRFCPLCATEFTHIDLLPVAVVCVGGVLALFGFGKMIGVGENAVLPENDQQKNRLKQQERSTARLSGSSVSTDPNNTALQTAPIANTQYNSGIAPLSQKSEQPVAKKASSEQEVFYCGVITKKGTPCTRRVKTKGPCWQHAKTGQIAPTRF